MSPSATLFTKYLNLYADKRIERFKIEGHFDTCVVVPAYNEAEYVFDLLESLEKAAESSKIRALILVLVNHKNSTHQKLKNSNFLVFDGCLFYSSKFIVVHPLDFISPSFEFQDDEGVGHARKIGGDLALRLYTQGQIESPYFHTTDGDARVSEDYFEINWKNDLAALVADYKHIASGDVDLDKAHELYEFSLRYYEEGLKKAGSPYAFPTIGSLLTISFEHYAKVRGFPKRLAAEDFYILNKLAKVGKIEKRKEVIYLRSRPSDRVPFGTGVGVKNILEEGLENFKIYNPVIFTELRKTLKALRDFPTHRNIQNTRNEIQNENTLAVLNTIGFFEILDEANKTRPNEKDCARHLVTAFDAFKTLKFVHGMRDLKYESVSWP